MNDLRISIIGAGNIGSAIARGILEAELTKNGTLYITRRKVEAIEKFKQMGAIVTSDNSEAIVNSDFIIIAVTPQQLNELLFSIKDSLENKSIISVVSGALIADYKKYVPSTCKVIRAMPNTAIAIKQSMTCLCAESKNDETLNIAKKIFDCLGKTIVINESQMNAATALCACGIAFFLRAIRAASQGGIEIGFHSEEALFMASQTALGAAALLLDSESHPENEVDKVTTPKGCTISGLREPLKIDL
jgi:pyrroline-5-carboxylate reductase